MNKMKNSPIVLALVSIFFTLIVGSYTYTYSEIGNAVHPETFNVLMDEFKRHVVDHKVDMDAAKANREESRESQAILIDLVKEVRKELKRE